MVRNGVQGYTRVEGQDGVLECQLSAEFSPNSQLSANFLAISQLTVNFDKSQLIFFPQFYILEINVMVYIFFQPGE